VSCFVCRDRQQQNHHVDYEPGNEFFWIQGITRSNKLQGGLVHGRVNLAFRPLRVKTLYKFQLGRQKRAFYLRRQSVNRIDRHDCHFTRGAKRQSDQINSRNKQLRVLTIRRNAHDPAPASQ